jgi:hypothetical protein
MIVCFLHAKVGHCQALYTQSSSRWLTTKNPPREGFVVCTALVLKEKVLFFLKTRCIVNLLAKDLRDEKDNFRFYAVFGLRGNCGGGGRK